MAKINLSISDELKAHMEKHPGVNWSQTASKHFESELLKIETASEKNLDLVYAIARLKASR